MKTTITFRDQNYVIDLDNPLDISLSLIASNKNPNAWYIEKPSIEPVENDGWIAKVSEGASINFNNIQFNPHAHGTHTECYGHISEEFYSVNEALKKFFFLAEVITVDPEPYGKEDYVISKKQLERAQKGKTPQAIVIRTMPNTLEKRAKQYSHTNWPYILEEAALYLREIGVEHLLIDLPSVDKEKDDGKMLAHRAFWNYPDKPRKHATITEFIYVKNEIKDGTYILNLQMASFENDASPSKPVLYEVL